jgi:hypothetical protein
MAFLALELDAGDEAKGLRTTLPPIRSRWV